MDIYISSGKGTGKTPLSAFDNALFNAGIHNYNLIVLSSIIPPGSIIKEKKYKSNPQEYGHRLYVVMSENRSREHNKCIGAAIGWYQIEDGRGVFVEHKTTGESEEAVVSNLNIEIMNSLSDLCRLRNIPFNRQKAHMKSSVSKITELASSVLVAAVYKSEPWNLSIM
ncbi:MAG: pyruvoyl-dependent arginine decarboxylase [Patescibacteria group bacterium]